MNKSTRKERGHNPFLQVVEMCYERGWKRLWTIDQSEMPEGMRFSLECFWTPRGATIFQVWPDNQGFACFTDNSPNTVSDFLKWLEESPATRG